MIAISDQPSIVKIAYSNIYWWCHKSWREKKLSFFPPFCLIHENCFSSSSACAPRNGRRRDKSKYLAIAAKILIQRVFIFSLDFYFLVNGLQLRSWSLWLRKQLKMSRIRNCAVDSNEKDGSFHNLSWARRKKRISQKVPLDKIHHEENLRSHKTNEISRSSQSSSPPRILILNSESQDEL